MALLAACAGSSHQAPADPTANPSHKGVVLLFRGMFSNTKSGMDQLALKLRALGLTANVYFPEEKSLAQDHLKNLLSAGYPTHKIAMAGHSTGVNMAISLASAANTDSKFAYLGSVEHSFVFSSVSKFHFAHNFYLREATLQTGERNSHLWNTDLSEIPGLEILLHTNADDADWVQRRMTQDIMVMLRLRSEDEL